MARHRKPKPPTREEQLKEKIREFVRSEQTIEDYEKILIAGSFAYRQGLGIPYEHVRRIIEEVLIEEGKLVLDEPVEEAQVPIVAEP